MPIKHINQGGFSFNFRDTRPAKVKAADKLGVTRENQVIHKT